MEKKKSIIIVVILVILCLTILGVVLFIKPKSNAKASDPKKEYAKTTAVAFIKDKYGFEPEIISVYYHMNGNGGVFPNFERDEDHAEITMKYQDQEFNVLFVPTSDGISTEDIRDNYQRSQIIDDLFTMVHEFNSSVVGIAVNNIPSYTHELYTGDLSTILSNEEGYSEHLIPLSYEKLDETTFRNACYEKIKLDELCNNINTYSVILTNENTEGYLSNLDLSTDDYELLTEYIDVKTQYDSYEVYYYFDKSKIENTDNIAALKISLVNGGNGDYVAFTKIEVPLKEFGNYLVYSIKDTTTAEPFVIVRKK